MSEETWIVTSHFKEDLTWLKGIGHPVVVVSKNQGFKDDSFLGLHHIPNKGLEFSSYLWFIFNYWDYIPPKVAFIHGHENSYHQSLSVIDVMKRFSESDLAGLNGERYSVSNYCHKGLDNFWFGSAFSDIWNVLGLGYVCGAPPVIVCQGSTQCLISRERIKSMPRSFYEDLFNKLMSSSDDRIVALVLELAWNIVFGGPAVDTSVFVKEFDEYCRVEKESVLITAPTYLWSSSMDRTVFFESQKNQPEWASSCLQILNLFGRSNELLG